MGGIKSREASGSLRSPHPRVHRVRPRPRPAHLRLSLCSSPPQGPTGAPTRASIADGAALQFPPAPPVPAGLATSCPSSSCGHFSQKPLQRVYQHFRAAPGTPHAGAAWLSHVLPGVSWRLAEAIQDWKLTCLSCFLGQFWWPPRLRGSWGSPGDPRLEVGACSLYPCACRPPPSNLVFFLHQRECCRPGAGRVTCPPEDLLPPAASLELGVCMGFPINR